MASSSRDVGPDQPRWSRSTAWALGACLLAIALAGARSAPCDQPDEFFGPLAACFAPGTPPERFAEVQAAVHDVNDRFEIENRWSRGESFQSVHLTYSFPPDGINVPSTFSGDPGGVNTLHATLNEQFDGDTAEWKRLFRDMFDEWAHITGNTYEEVADDGASWPTAAGDPARGDIRIVMRNIDGPFDLLGLNFFPDQGDMLLDASENWAVPNSDFLFMRNVLSHEHGHGLGLAHVCPVEISKLMEPIFTTAFEGPQLDDKRGAQDRYGDRFEPNNLATTQDAAFIPNLTPTSNLVVSDLSIHRRFDRDLFIIPSTGDLRLNATAVPVGETYLSGPQQSNGVCTSGSSVNALIQQNLTLTVYAADGETVVASSNAGGLGQSESLSDVLLSPEGVYYLEVASSTSSPSASVQLYSLGVSLGGSSSVPGDIDGDGCVDAFDLAELLSSWGPGVSPADLNADGVVDAFDLADLLTNWSTDC